MRTIQNALVEARVVANLDHHEELAMEDDSELNPIQRRIIIRRIHRRQADEDHQRQEARDRRRRDGNGP
jgi:hypothetical protein